MHHLPMLLLLRWSSSSLTSKSMLLHRLLHPLLVMFRQPLDTVCALKWVVSPPVMAGHISLQDFLPHAIRRIPSSWRCLLTTLPRVWTATVVDPMPASSPPTVLLLASIVTVVDPTSAHSSPTVSLLASTATVAEVAQACSLVTALDLDQAASDQLSFCWSLLASKC